MALSLLSRRLGRPSWRTRMIGAAVLAGAAVGVLALLSIDSSPAAANAFQLERLVSDTGGPSLTRDPTLVNGWGLAASPTGPWWTTSEARNTSALYSGAGRKQALTISVPGGPTGIVYNDGPGFPVRGGGVTAPARFLYACEDGAIRAWAPSVPHGWSTTAEVTAFGGVSAVLRGITIAKLPDGSRRLYATDFHIDGVVMFDEHWRKVVLKGAFRDPDIPPWYVPFNILAAGGHVYVTFAQPAPVNGNDSPTGGYVDEFDVDGHLLARVGTKGDLNQPYGLALAPQGFGRLGGDLLVANFGTGFISVYKRHGTKWSAEGLLRDEQGRPLKVPGVWGIAFGNGAMAGPRDALFFAAGPHRWTNATEEAVHGLFGSISARG